MGSLVVVVLLEFGKGVLKFGAACEAFTGEKFVAELPKEALDISVLPRLAWLDEFVLHADLKGSELGSVVTDEPLRAPMNQEEPLQFFLDLE